MFLPKILRASGRLSLTSQVGCFQDIHTMDATSDRCTLMPAWNSLYSKMGSPSLAFLIIWELSPTEPNLESYEQCASQLHFSNSQELQKDGADTHLSLNYLIARRPPWSLAPLILASGWSSRPARPWPHAAPSISVQVLLLLGPGTFQHLCFHCAPTLCLLAPCLSSQAPPSQAPQGQTHWEHPERSIVPLS